MTAIDSIHFDGDASATQTSEGTAAAMGGSKKKKKKAKGAGLVGAKRKGRLSGSGNGRKARGPSPDTIKKQMWVVEQLERDSKKTINELMDGVRKQFKTMLSFDRTKEAKAAFEAGKGAIEKLSRGEFQGAAGGRSRRTTISGAKAPQFMVATKKRSKWQFEEVGSEGEANRRVQELVSQGESPAVYRRVDLRVNVRIGR